MLTVVNAEVVVIDSRNVAMDSIWGLITHLQVWQRLS